MIIEIDGTEQSLLLAGLDSLTDKNNALKAKLQAGNTPAAASAQSAPESTGSADTESEG